MISIKISTDYTKKPGGRFVSDGEFSGEDFRTKILLPKYYEALKSNDKLFVDLDDCLGMPTSFLEEAFGGLVRIEKNRKLLDILEIKSDDRPNLVEKIQGYIKDAEVE